MLDLALYHVSSETPIKMDTYLLGKVFEACIKCRAFVVGYNLLEVANDTPDLVLLALTMKDEPGHKEAFEVLTNLKLVRVERESDGQTESRD